MNILRLREFWGLGFNDLDEYGFQRPNDFNYEDYEKFKSRYRTVLDIQSRKWSELLIQENALKKGKRLKSYIRLGIPATSRNMVWLAVSGAKKLQSKMPDDLYHNLLKLPCHPPLRAVVLVDLHRTYPDNIFFQSPGNYQTELYNVLISYAKHNPEVGYCQGLNYIGGMLLLCTMSAETTFWLLKVLVENILKDYYCRTMEGVVVDTYVLGELIRKMVPDVYEHVSNLGVCWPIIVTKWFVCLYADVLPVETVLRIWDCLFSEGSKILFRVAITLIICNRTKILACRSFADVAECFKNITKNNLAMYCHEFMESIFKVPGKLSNSTIEKLRKKARKKIRSKKKEIEKRAKANKEGKRKSSRTN